jgi:hypothetical protein
VWSSKNPALTGTLEAQRGLRWGPGYTEVNGI